jgi:hypothetical protein
MEEYNADALNEARVTDAAAFDALAAMTYREEDKAAVEQKVIPAIVVVEPALDDKGKTLWPKYVSALRAALTEVAPSALGVWAAAQRETLEKCPVAQRVMAIRAIGNSAGELGVQAPVWLGDLIKPRAAKAAAALPAQAEQDPALKTDDARWVDQRIAELAAMDDRTQFDLLVTSAAVRTMMAKLRREDRALFDRADDAFSATHERLPATDAGDLGEN